MSPIISQFPTSPMNAKQILAAVMLLLTLLFSVQNAGTVEVSFLLWHFNTSLALILFITLATGLIGGWAIASSLR